MPSGPLETIGRGKRWTWSKFGYKHLSNHSIIRQREAAQFKQAG
jgi:hypothetical protein